MKMFCIFVFGFLGCSIHGWSAELEDRVRESAPIIEKIAGEKFAGTWISEDGSRQIVALTSAVDTTSLVFNDVDISYVKYSKNYLMSVQDKFLKNDIIDNKDIYGTAIDFEKNRVLVRAKKSNFHKIILFLKKKNVDMNAIVLDNQDEPLNLFNSVDAKK